MSSVPPALVFGAAAGVPYVALPPTTCDADITDPVGLIVALHGMEPPRSPLAFAAAMPLTGVPVWRVYLGLPMFGTRLPVGGPDEVLARARHDFLGELYGPVVEQAAYELPDAVAEIREDLGLPSTPMGLVGFSAGAAAAFLALAQGALRVRACALIAPTISPTRLVSHLEKETGALYHWTDSSRHLAERLDLTARASEVVVRNPAFLLVAGTADTLVTPADVAGLRDLLRTRGATKVEAATFKMGHALAAEPGIEPCPPITEAVSVDSALTSWFRDRFNVVPRQENDDAEPATPATPDRPQRQPLFDLSQPATSEADSSVGAADRRDAAAQILHVRADDAATPVTH